MNFYVLRLPFQTVYRRFADEATRSRMLTAAVDETLSVSELLLLLREGGVLDNGGRPLQIENPVEAAAARAKAEAEAAQQAEEAANAASGEDTGKKKDRAKSARAKSAKSRSKPAKKPSAAALEAAAAAEAAAKAKAEAEEAEAARIAALTAPGKIKLHDAVGVFMETTFGYNPLTLEEKSGDQEPAQVEDLMDVELVYWEFLNCLAAIAESCLASKDADAKETGGGDDEEAGATNDDDSPNDDEAALGASSSDKETVNAEEAESKEQEASETSQPAADEGDDAVETGPETDDAETSAPEHAASRTLNADNLSEWLDNLLQSLELSVVR